MLSPLGQPVSRQLSIREQRHVSQVRISARDHCGRASLAWLFSQGADQSARTVSSFANNYSIKKKRNNVGAVVADGSVCRVFLLSRLFSTTDFCAQDGAYTGRASDKSPNISNVAYGILHCDKNVIIHTSTAFMEPLFIGILAACGVNPYRQIADLNDV